MPYGGMRDCGGDQRPNQYDEQEQRRSAQHQ
jgi:hypothetical protein